MPVEIWSGAAVALCIVLVSVIGLFALLILWKIWRNEINIGGLLAEGTDGKASLSRFQFLVFTFIIGGLYLILSLESGNLIDVPTNALLLLGISAGSYTISRGISATTDNTKAKANADVAKTQANADAGSGTISS
jgi:hypothetical protein